MSLCGRHHAHWMFMHTTWVRHPIWAALRLSSIGYSDPAATGKALTRAHPEEGDPTPGRRGGLPGCHRLFRGINLFGTPGWCYRATGRWPPHAPATVPPAVRSPGRLRAPRTPEHAVAGAGGGLLPATVPSQPFTSSTVFFKAHNSLLSMREGLR